jgi:pimeloyl-ACP methyl ester carboxylesterase
MPSVLPRRRQVAGLNYERRGQGPPLVLIHGIGGELCVWEPVLDRLAEDFDVIAVDLPGFGASPPLPDGTEPSPGRLAIAVADFLSEAGVARPHVCGNSLGGWVGLELAKARRAASVTALCPAGLWGAPIRRAGAPETQGRLHSFARSVRPIVPALMLSRRARRLALGHVVAHPDRVSRQAARRMVCSYARATAYDATNSAMLSTHFTGAEAIEIPLTVAFGELDRLIRPARLRARGARSVVLPGCGHIPMWDDPELVVKLILETSSAAG